MFGFGLVMTLPAVFGKVLTGMCFMQPRGGRKNVFEGCKVRLDSANLAAHQPIGGPGAIGAIGAIGANLAAHRCDRCSTPESMGPARLGPSANRRVSFLAKKNLQSRAEKELGAPRSREQRVASSEQRATRREQNRARA